MNKRYSKLAALAAALLMCLALTACGNSVEIPGDFGYDDFSQFVKLGEYKGLEYTEKNTKVTDKDVEDRIKTELEANPVTENIKKGTVKKTDKVNVDYEGKIDGKKADNATAEDQTIDIPNDSYIDGFKESMVGHKVGDTYTVDLSFPDDYSTTELQGKPVSFKITINYIVKVSTPELTDEYCAKNTEYKTVADYRKGVRKSLEEAAKANDIDEERSELFSKVLNASSFQKLPEKEVNDTVDNIKANYTRAAEQYGMSYEDYVKSSGMSVEDFDKQLKTAAENTVRQELVVYSLSKELGVSVSKSEYNDYLNDLLKKAGYDDAKAFETAAGTSLAEYAEENYMYETMVYQKVMDKVMELGKAKK